jgi:hypothetical protein
MDRPSSFRSLSAPGPSRPMDPFGPIEPDFPVPLPGPGGPPGHDGGGFFAAASGSF